MMRLEDLAFAPVVLPLLGAAMAFCAKAFLKGRATRILEYAGAAVGLGLPWISFAATFQAVMAGEVLQGVVGGWYGGVGVLYRFDGLAWLVNVLGYSVAIASWVYSLGAGPRGPTFTAVFLIQTAALAATAMTADLFNLFVCLEVMGIASYVLVASSDKPGALLASFSYLMVSATAMVFFLLGVYGFYRLTGSLSYVGISEALRTLPDSGGTAALVSLALVTAAVAVRVAVMPLYGWLPDAHALAPHAISAVLSGVLIKTPLFALSRVLLILPAGSLAGEMMGYSGAVTALAGVILALSQKDAKKLLAYHSISQIGYVVCAWGAAIAAGMATETGRIMMAAAFLHAFYHALFKGLLFLTVGTTTDCAGQRDVHRLRGAARLLRSWGGERIPLTLVGFSIGALAISAVPPFNGFASKTALSEAMKGSWQYGLLFVAGIGTATSFIKLSRIYWPAGKGVVGRPRDAATVDVAGYPRDTTTRATVLLAEGWLALLCVAGGIAASPIFAVVYRLLSENGTADAVSLGLYSWPNLLKTTLTLAGGALLFFGVVSGPGSAALKRIRERSLSFHGLFVSFAFGTAFLTWWLLYGFRFLR